MNLYEQRLREQHGKQIVPPRPVVEVHPERRSARQVLLTLTTLGMIAQAFEDSQENR